MNLIPVSRLDEICSATHAFGMTVPEQRELVRGYRLACSLMAGTLAAGSEGLAVQMQPIGEGLTDERFGRFGHHPDPAIDFCVEVESLQSRLFNARQGLCKPGGTPECVNTVKLAIARAMDFNVGGDQGAVAAKQQLRALEHEALLTAPPQAPERRPMATAPRDGTTILLWWGNDGVSQGRYRPEVDKYPWEFIDGPEQHGGWIVNHATDGVYGPTHWSPFPPDCAQSDSERLDWLERQKVELIVPTSWGAAPDPKLPIRAWIDQARERAAQASSP